MWKFSSTYLISALLLILIAVSAVFSMHYAKATSLIRLLPTRQEVSPGIRIASQANSFRTVNMHRVVPITTAEAHFASFSPSLSSSEPGFAAHLLQEAEKNKNMPVSHSSVAIPTVTTHKTGKIAIANGFTGLAQSCCQPPDLALAASPQWVLQAVNQEIAVYYPSGLRLPGWPKSLASFFGIQVPTNCTRNPFISAPRANYDINKQRFWVVATEDEGLTNTCPFKSLMWVAVSQTNDPNGRWHIYTFNMASGTHNAARFTQFALDQQAIYFSANMYGASGKGPFRYAELFASLKAPLEAGQANISYYGFIGQKVGNQPVDTLQPVQAQEDDTAWLHGGLFINAFNITSGGGHCVYSCSGIVIWSLTHPGQSNDILTGVIAPSLPYALAPLANQPGCKKCFAQKSPPDTRISATPIYHSGLISFALVTGINNQHTIVPGILWGQIAPLLSTTGTLSGASMYQNGYFNFAGNEAALYPSLAVNNAGDLSLLYDYTGSNFNPGTAVTTRPVTFKHGRFPDGGIFLHRGEAPTVNVYWGNYTATSYEGSATDKVWFSGQFSDAHHNWATYIASSQGIRDGIGHG